MRAIAGPQLEQNIARARIVLSVAALVAVYVDPAQPLLSHWIPLVSGAFVMDARLVAVMLLHLAYSLYVYFALNRGWLMPARIVVPTIWIDVLFAAAVGLLTEGETSPAFPFFAFAVLAAGLRAGLRQAMWVTAVSVGLYEGCILISSGGGAESYLMRPVYLALTGYLVGYLGEQWIEVQDELRQFEITAQRHRIARDLHDNFAQALAGISLRLEGCRKKARAHPGAELLPDLTALQESVTREHDQLRSFTRSLAGLEATEPAVDTKGTSRLALHAELSAPIDLVDHVLQITREGIANIRRHAYAERASIDIQAGAEEVRVSIEDDGVGFPDTTPPWSIASRVRECGGRIEVVAHESGGRLLITVPYV